MRKRPIWGLGLAALLGSLASFFWVKAQKGFSARDEPSAPEAFVARLMRSLSMPSGAKQLKSPKRLDDAAILTTRMHWADHCALCHANDGSEQSPKWMENSSP